AVGACWDGAGAPGLWPWVQVLRSLHSSLGEEAWQQASRFGDEALTRLLESDEPPPSAEFHLFESMLQLLVGVCEQRPLVVLLDDLQWADPMSMSFVAFLDRHAVHVPLLIVGTYRSDEVGRSDRAQSAAIADLAENALTMPLGGLDNDSIRELRE